jgi:hypothetical protein
MLFSKRNDYYSGTLLQFLCGWWLLASAFCTPHLDLLLVLFSFLSVEPEADHSPPCHFYALTGWCSLDPEGVFLLTDKNQFPAFNGH